MRACYLQRLNDLLHLASKGAYGQDDQQAVAAEKAAAQLLAELETEKPLLQQDQGPVSALRFLLTNFRSLYRRSYSCGGGAKNEGLRGKRSGVGDGSPPEHRFLLACAPSQWWSGHAQKLGSLNMPVDPVHVSLSPPPSLIWISPSECVLEPNPFVPWLHPALLACAHLWGGKYKSRGCNSRVMRPKHASVEFQVRDDQSCSNEGEPFSDGSVQSDDLLSDSSSDIECVAVAHGSKSHGSSTNLDLDLFEGSALMMMGVRRRPTLSLCLERLLSQPPPTVQSARRQLPYLMHWVQAGEVSTRDRQSVQGRPFVPVADTVAVALGEDDVGGDEPKSRCSLRCVDSIYLHPTAVVNNSEPSVANTAASVPYAGLLDYVDMGGVANAVLNALGVERSVSPDCLAQVGMLRMHHCVRPHGLVHRMCESYFSLLLL
jgi:hypothetical protein